MKAVIFDIGNVIQPISWEDAAEVFKVSEQEYKAAFMDQRESYWDLYKTGDISFLAFANHVLDNLGVPITPGNINFLSSSMDNLAGQPDSELIDLIRSLDPELKKAILSNSCPELERTARSYDFLELFEPHVYFSHKIKAKKPEQQAFNHAVNGLDLKHQDCLLVDNKQRNISAAEEFGLQGVLYTGVSDLRQALSDYIP